MRLLQWKKLSKEPSTLIVPELAEFAHDVFVKNYYSAFTPALLSTLKKHSIKQLLVCGLETDACVLKTTLDAFENDFEPFVVEDATTSNGGDEIHASALKILGRYIGKERIISTQAALKIIR